MIYSILFVTISCHGKLNDKHNALTSLSGGHCFKRKRSAMTIIFWSLHIFYFWIGWEYLCVGLIYVCHHYFLFRIWDLVMALVSMVALFFIKVCTL